MRHPELSILGYFCQDTNVYPDREERQLGGGAFFAAQSASLFTSDVGVVTRVGANFPVETLRSPVRREGIVSSALPTMEARLVYSGENFGQRDISMNWGASTELSARDFPLEWLISTQLLLLSTMEPMQQATILKAVRHLAPHMFIALDSTEAYLQHAQTRNQVAENYRAADLVFANRHEYKALEGLFPALPRAVVKFDGDGAQYMEYGVPKFSVRAPEVSAVDVTGAGDILAGAFLAQVSIGQDSEHSLQRAVEIASLSVSQKGTDHIFAVR